MNALVPPPRPARETEPESTEPRLVAIAAEGWLGLPVPLALDRLLDRLEAPEAPPRRR